VPAACASSGATCRCPTSSIARGDLAEAQFEKALREGRFSDRVAHDVASAESAGVAETPTFFINDVRYRGAHDLESLEAAIRVALRMTESRAELARDEV
jgi:predicted DsbA family dithiol-disulfide isomerase